MSDTMRLPVCLSVCLTHLQAHDVQHRCAAVVVVIQGLGDACGWAATRSTPQHSTAQHSMHLTLLLTHSMISGSCQNTVASNNLPEETCLTWHHMVDVAGHELLIDVDGI